MAGIRSSRQGSSERPVVSEIFDPTFTDFVRRIVSVPHSEIKAKLDAEREAKRASKASVSHDSAVPSKAH
jgi:hypothetical protein